MGRAESTEWGFERGRETGRRRNDASQQRSANSSFAVSHFPFQQTYPERQQGLYWKPGCKMTMVASTVTQRNLKGLWRHPHKPSPPVPLSQQDIPRMGAEHPLQPQPSPAWCQGDSFLPAMPPGRGTRGKAFLPPSPAKAFHTCARADFAS